MVAVLTQNEFVGWLYRSIGRKYDHDGWYGYQCYDYANAGWSVLYPGTSLEGLYAADIAKDNKALLKGKATVHKNTLSFLAKPGDMVLFDKSYGEGTGHVAWVYSATLTSITVIEQNWQGGGWDRVKAQGGTGWETATLRTHSYDPTMIFIRPKFKTNKVTATVTRATKKVVKAVTKKKTKWSWTGRFTPNTLIKVRRSPSLSGSIVDKGSWLKNKRDWVDFNQVIKANGYWWIRFKYPTNPKAGYFYCAVCKITDPKQKIKKEKYWGTIKWKKTK